MNRTLLIVIIAIVIVMLIITWAVGGFNGWFSRIGFGIEPDKNLLNIALKKQWIS